MRTFTLSNSTELNKIASGRKKSVLTQCQSVIYVGDVIRFAYVIRVGAKERRMRHDVDKMLFKVTCVTQVQGNEVILDIEQVQYATDTSKKEQDYREPKTHRLKIAGETLADAVLYGMKPFEIRKNDRDFREGDWLVFTVVDGEDRNKVIEHAISTRTYEITFITEGFGLEPGYVAMGIRDMDY